MGTDKEMEGVTPLMLAIEFGYDAYDLLEELIKRNNNDTGNIVNVS